MKLNKTDVQKSIFQQTIQKQKIYYSYANKSQATLSMLKNQRLLIFNSKTGLLYYINEPKSLPFGAEIPKPKNDVADMNISMAKNPPGTNEFNVQFMMKNQKGEVISLEWNFLLDNKQLAAAWLKVIQQYKDRKMQEILDQQNKTQQKDPKKNSRTISNNAFIHDTLGYGMIQAPKSNSRKPSPEQKQQTKEIIGSNKMAQSKYEISPQKPSPNSNLQNSNIQPPNTNLQGSNATLQNSGSKPPIINTIQPTLPIPSNQNSRQTISQLSPQRRSRINEGDSRLTFKDQLESIISRNRSYQSNANINQSRGKNYDPQNDWNLKFLNNQSQEIIMDFENYAVKQFFSILKDDRMSNEAIRVYIRPDSLVIVTDARTIQAKKIKSEFRNYHFITESCKDHFIVGVPLACLIEFQGIVGLVKSLIPDDAPRLQLTQQLMLDLKDLQRYTRIKNNVLKKATLYDLSHIYGSTGKRLIYINQLIEYLPVHVEESFTGGCLRPEHMLDNVEQFMAGGMMHDANRQDMKTLNDTLELIKRNVIQLAKQLSSQDITFANGLQLKDIMHSRGINLKYLPLLYQQTQSKQVKKYIHTFMVAKVAKDNILQNLSETRLDQSSTLIKETIEKSIKLLIEGNSNLSNELWKEIAVNFRKEYNTPMSNHDIVGPFFLNCLMKIIPGTYDLSKVNIKKIFFKEDQILSKGFIVELLPKVKSYYRYTTQDTQKIMAICKGQKLYDNYLEIVEQLQLKTRDIPHYLGLSQTDQALKQYMSYYTCPKEFQPSQFPHIQLFQSVLAQPPTSSSLIVTYNYLIWCLEKQKFSEFKYTLQQTLKSIDYWFDPGHVFHCQFYEALSQYYEQTGAIQDSINFMKESLAVCIRSGGVGGKRTGEKYFALGEKQLKAGRMPQSMQNFLKSKANMQAHNVSTINYPLVLTKLATLSLSQSDFSSCVQYSKLSVQKFEQLQAKRAANLPKGIYDEYSIKALDIMSRAFEIEDKKNEFYRMAQLASTKYNKTTNPRVFINLTKLCLTAVVFKQSIEKAKIFQSLIQKLIAPTNQSQEIMDRQSSLEELMNLALQFNVMQKFMFRFQSLQRIVSDINSRRALTNENKEFVTILKLIIGLVGEDYVFGLIQEKEVE